MTDTPQKNMLGEGTVQYAVHTEEQMEAEIDLLELLYRLLEKAKWIVLASVLGLFPQSGESVKS